jgi:Holliday junction resolvase RusA-like endonuclease
MLTEHQDLLILETCIYTKPIGVNNVYSQSKSGRRFTTSKGKHYKELIYIACLLDRKKIDLSKIKSYRVAYEFGVTDGLKKDGTIKTKRHDIDGFIKLVQDSAFESLGVDDSLVTELSAIKKFDDDYVKIKIFGLL